MNRPPPPPTTTAREATAASSTRPPSRIVVTTGDPAGIGPDIALLAATAPPPARVAVIGDRDMLAARAKTLAETRGVRVKVVEYDAADDDPEDNPTDDSDDGTLSVIHQPCSAPVIPGELDARNSEYVVRCIDAAVDSCINGAFEAMVTGPVNKAIINQAGIEFRGHTEWLAHRCRAATPVMMLANAAMRVCLLTNHIPLAEVARRVTARRLTQVIGVIRDDLRRRFNIAHPTLGVCGLNPHAGEGGYIGTEEVEVIAPTLTALRARGARIIGPLSADTAFTPARLAPLDALLVMYHDQGLPAIKQSGFGETVNITLGLPIVRTSVDHGTATELAGTFQADESSFKAALNMAITLSHHANHHTAAVTPPQSR